MTVGGLGACGGTETCRVPDEEVGGGEEAENGGCKKVFFHLVMHQGSDLGLDE